MSGINSIASTPEEPQEYLFEIWQPATILFGESSSETNDIMVLEIVTFKGSEVIRMTVSPLNLSLSFSAPDTRPQTARACSVAAERMPKSRAPHHAHDTEPKARHHAPQGDS